MTEEIKWALGAVMTLISLIGGLITRDRQLMSKIDDGDSKMQAKLELLQRDQIDIRSSYARREDLKEHLQSIEKMVALSREEQRELSKRFDSLIQLMHSIDRKN